MKTCVDFKNWYQDGGKFYNEETGELIADYSFMVDNDHDTDGATAARKQFITVYIAPYEQRSV